MRKYLIIFLLFPAILFAQNLSLGLGLNKGGISADPYCDEADAYFARLTVEPEIPIKVAYNTMIETLVDNGIWSKLAILYSFRVADSADYVKNLISSSYTITKVGAPVFEKFNGVTGVNASSSYLKTGFVPTADSSIVKRYSASMGIWSNTHNQSATSAADCGARDGVNALYKKSFKIEFRKSSTNKCLFSVNDSTNPAGTVIADSSTGLFTVSRTNATTMNAYRNLTDLNKPGTPDGLGLCGMELYICTYNNANNTPGLVTSRQYYYFFVGSGLSAAEVTIIYNAFAALNTAIEAYKASKLRVIIASNEIYARSYFDETYDAVIVWKKATQMNQNIRRYAAYRINKSCPDVIASYTSGSNGITVNSNSDEYAPNVPLNTMGNYGGSHNFDILRIYGSHDKVWANDGGSLWRNNTTISGVTYYWYLAKISTDTLFFVSKSYAKGSTWEMVTLGSKVSNGYTDTLIWVSGGSTSHTTKIASTTNALWLSQYVAENNILNHTVSYLVNGTTTYPGGLVYCDSLKIDQNFDWVEPRSLKYTTNGDFSGGEAWYNEDLDYDLYPYGGAVTTNRKRMTAGNITDVEGVTHTKQYYVDDNIGRSYISAPEMTSRTTVGTTYTQLSIYIPDTKPAGNYVGKSITTGTQASPIEITSTGHGLSTNDYAEIIYCRGNWEAINSIWKVTRVDANKFTLTQNYFTGLISDGTTLGAFNGPGALSSLAVTYKDIDNITTPTMDYSPYFTLNYLDTTNSKLMNRVVFYLSKPATPTVYEIANAGGIIIDYENGTRLSRLAGITLPNQPIARLSYNQKLISYLNVNMGIVTSFDFKVKQYYVLFNPTRWSANTSDCYFYKDRGVWWVYIDYHKTVTNDAVTLPAALWNKSITVYDSSGCTVSSTTVPSTGILCTVSGTYGYAILKLQ